MKIPSVALAPIVALFFAGAIMIANTWQLPSTEHIFTIPSGKTVKLEMIVEGVKCRGTANFFSELMSRTKGVSSVTTFVQEHRVIIEYDQTMISEEEIIATIDNPALLPDGGKVDAFFVLEVNHDIK